MRVRERAERVREKWVLESDLRERNVHRREREMSFYRLLVSLE